MFLRYSDFILYIIVHLLIRKGYVNIMVDLRAKPYYLNDEDIAWVNNTIASMTDEEKVGQLFW